MVVKEAAYCHSLYHRRRVLAASVCTCQIVWFTRVLEELGHEARGSISILCDNTSTIKLSKNPVFHGRCEPVNEGAIRLEHCETQKQVADIFTKPLK